MWNMPNRQIRNRFCSHWRNLLLSWPGAAGGRGEVALNDRPRHGGLAPAPLSLSPAEHSTGGRHVNGHDEPRGTPARQASWVSATAMDMVDECLC